MRSRLSSRMLTWLRWTVFAVAVFVGVTAAGPVASAQRASSGAAASTAAQTFRTPEQAANALVAAAETFDVHKLIELFGMNGTQIVLTGEYGQDRERATDFAAKAREKMRVSIDPATQRRANLIVGKEDWPFPIPLVKTGARWSFDAAAGQQEMRARQIGRNELDAITISRGYVEAQHEYALKPREGYTVNQYARRIISTPGTQDGLAWQNADGTWGGPIGEKIAKAIQEGAARRSEPYHGYFFKPLKGQGPAAPLGQLDYEIDGVMIGGFAMVAAPAEYGVTGLKTFMVSQDGVVYEKDFGPATSTEFAKMERFNPDRSWTPVLEVADD